MVFVHRNGNTVVADPVSLGGGATDAHLIYEGLSRVAADAVLAGAASVGANAFFSVWHPELVSLRRALGLSRHPAQVVLSHRGRVNLDALLFNVPDVPVFLILGEEGVRRCHEQLAERPWITIMPAAGLRYGRRLPSFASCTAWRAFHTSAVIRRDGPRGCGPDSGLCLTTTAHRGGQPDHHVFRPSSARTRTDRAKANSGTIAVNLVRTFRSEGRLERVIMRRTIIGLLLLSTVAFAQESPTFEVVSIRPSSEQVTQVSAGLRIAGSQVRLGSMSLKDYIGMAYGVRPQQIAGPDWLGQQRFDLTADSCRRIGDASPR
jgi:hypothetical protein